MATTTVSGSTVVFSNSTAAANLTQTGSEDSSLSFSFDVLAASGGGKNTTIWSVDDGSVDSAYSGTLSKNFLTYDTDLLSKDTAIDSWQVGGETSDLGAHIWIGSDNKIHYEIDPASDLGAQIQALGAGEQFTDTIKYTIRMSNGTLSVGTLSVVINGTNDAAVITGSSTAALTETDAAQSTGGNLDATDVDSSNAFVAQTDVAGSNNYGTFSIDDTGAWTYTMNGAHDEFVGGQDYTDSITVKTADGTSQVITVTMHGTNDLVVASLPTTYTGTGDTNDFDNLGLPGPQTINDGNANVTRYGGAGNDTINGENGGDVLFGGSGDDTLTGGNGTDAIYGGSGTDTISGNNAPDSIYGGFGADIIDGGTEADTIYFIDLRDTGDTINNFLSGQDKIDLSAIDSGDGDHAFDWGGQQAGQYVQAHSVTWFQSGSNVVVLADTDGNLTTAEFSITLTGISNLNQNDFLL